MNCHFTQAEHNLNNQSVGDKFMSRFSRIVASATLAFMVFLGVSSIAKADQIENVPAVSQLKGLTGAKLSQADVKGKVVVFQFFASWCVGCEKTMEDMIQMTKAHPEVLYIPVSVDEDVKSAKSFFVNKSVAVKALESRAFVDASTEFAARLNVKAVPTVVIANGQGIVIARSAGHPSKERFAEFQASLGAAAPTSSASSALGASH